MRTIPHKLLINSKHLRKNQTPWESKLWAQLRSRRFQGVKFKRQVQIGRYIVDFSCREKKLILELDGSRHNTYQGKNADLQKQAFLEKEGYKVLHFWNNEIDDNIEGVLERVRKELGV